MLEDKVPLLSSFSLGPFVSQTLSLQGSFYLMDERCLYTPLREPEAGIFFVSRGIVPNDTRVIRAITGGCGGTRMVSLVYLLPQVS